MVQCVSYWLCCFAMWHFTSLHCILHLCNGEATIMATTNCLPSNAHARYNQEGLKKAVDVPFCRVLVTPLSYP